jgi:Domain of unknown function (DUF4440)
MNATRCPHGSSGSSAALTSGDGEQLTCLLHEDFRWTAHTGDTYDRSEYLRRNTKGQTVWQSQDLGRPHVLVVGDTPVVCTEVIDVLGAAEPEVFRMPMTQTWIRQTDGWRRLAGHAGALGNGVSSIRGWSDSLSASVRVAYVRALLSVGADLASLLGVREQVGRS